MVTIRSRKFKDGNSVLLYVRVKDSARDNATALGISVPVMRWNTINDTLKQAKEAYKRGSTIFIEDKLAARLWQLVKELTMLQEEGILNEPNMAASIRTIMKNDSEVLNSEKLADVPKNEATKPSFTDFIAQYISECLSGERLKKKSTQKIKESSVKSYKGFLAQVVAYEQNRHRRLDWDDITFDFYDDFKRFLIEKNYSPNTIARHIKDMKTILYAAKDMHYTTRDDFTSKKWSADREDVDNIYINDERLREMAAFDMSDYGEMRKRAIRFAKDEKERDDLLHALRRDTFRRNLGVARDIFVMGCITGQRISDYKRISKDMIETIVGERRFLHLKQQKTGKDVYIPYDDLMGDILQRYDGELPKVYDQHINERIKKVGLLLGWTEPAGMMEHKGLMEYPSEKRFCDAIMTHTARRSFATNAYKAGISLSAIMAVTGHSSEEMLKRYLKLGSKERALLAAAEFDKVKAAL